MESYKGQAKEPEPYWEEEIRELNAICYTPFHARVCWTARSNLSIQNEINIEYSLERLMLKFQYFGHLIQRADSLEKTLMLGKIEGRRRRGQQRTRWLDSITDSIDMNLSKLREIVKDRGTWRASPWVRKESARGELSMHEHLMLRGL